METNYETGDTFKSCTILKKNGWIYVFGSIHTRTGTVFFPPELKIQLDANPVELGDAVKNLINRLPAHIVETSGQEEKHACALYFQKEGFKHWGDFMKKSFSVAIAFDGIIYELFPMQDAGGGVALGDSPIQYPSQISSQDIGSGILDALLVSQKITKEQKIKLGPDHV